MKIFKLLLIPLIIILMWLIIYFLNQNVDRVILIRDITISNLRDNEIYLKLSKDWNIFEEKRLGKNEEFLLKYEN